MTTDWRPASFRGVPFRCAESPAHGGGRRVVDHQIFGADGFTEDTGPELPTFTLAAFVVGVDYIAQGDALEDALNASGPGVLVHPTKGSRSVQIGTWSATVSYRRIDYAIECRESGYPLPPAEIEDATVWTWTDTLRGAINGAFVATFDVVNQAADVATSAINDANEAAEAVNDAAKKFASLDIAGGILQAVENLAATADATVRLPADLAASWGELLAPLSRAGRQASLAALAGISAPIAAPTNAIETNRNAIAQMVRCGLAATLCDAFVNDIPATREDALAALDTVSAMVKRVAGESTDADVWRATMDARDATVRAAGRLITRLPQTRVYTPNQSASVFEVSARLFGNGSQVDDLLTRNAIVNPLWITDPVRALAVA